MFTRIWACRNLCKISKHILVTQQFAATSKCFIFQTPRYLHVKTYDKDAGLEKQRAANKISHTDEQEFEGDKSVLPKIRRRKHNVNREELNLKPDSLESKEMMKTTELGISQERVVADKTKEDPDVFGNAPKEAMEEDEGILIFLNVYLNNVCNSS